MSTRDLIDAIESGSAADIQAAFEGEMASRIAERLDTMRQEVSKDMFNEARKMSSKMAEDEHEDDEEDEDEEDEDEDELKLEDYSLEEIEDFMMSEDFEQLDELSKRTLGSYAKKAAHDAVIQRKIGADFENRANKARKPGMKSSAEKLGKDYTAKSRKRRAGINTAVDRLTKEDVDASIDEAMDQSKIHPNALHVKPVGGGKYKIHAVGKNFAHGMKAGEHLSDSELDDFAEMGGKVKHVK
jgi:hypothetical protein